MSGFLPPRGTRAPAGISGHVVRVERGGSSGCNYERVGIVTSSTADHPTRRDFLFGATGAAAAAGGLATLWPFVSQMNPDASTIAAGAPIEVDLSPVAEGQDIKVFWRGKPIYNSHRTKQQIDEARAVPVASLPDPQSDLARVKAGRGRGRGGGGGGARRGGI